MFSLLFDSLAMLLDDGFEKEKEPATGAARFNRIVRYTIMVVSFGVSIVGIIMMTGLLVIPRIPKDFRVVAGAVVFLYGAYRFVIAYLRERRS